MTVILRIGAAVMAIGFEIACKLSAAAFAEEKIKRKPVPVLSSDNAVKVATPFTVLTSIWSGEDSRTAPLSFASSLTETVAALTTVFPPKSSMRMSGAGLMAVPATASEGWTTILRVDATPTLMSKTDETMVCVSYVDAQKSESLVQMNSWLSHTSA